jgi:hypothetical protein
MDQQLLLIEMNEINFGFVEAYIRQRKLPNFRTLFESHGFQETSSETRYEQLEPWIQWVTAHTGLTFAQHRVFRLGDIVGTGLSQIWEELEAAGFKVGAISPMNAANQLNRPAFFVPDPWTDTPISTPPTDRRFFEAVRQAVNDNASGRISPRSVVNLAIGALRNTAPFNYLNTLGLLRAVGRRPWNRAIILDQMLADMFIRLTRKTNPDFASLFLNAGAHIQHHYMFNSAVYVGTGRNPEWYISPGEDPLLQVYELYDRVLSRVRQVFPSARLMLATGLHQNPCGSPIFYWRLVNHAAFLSALSIPFTSVEPRMSRDFLMSCASTAEASEAERRLRLATATDGKALFEVDNRGTSLFVTLSYPDEITGTLGVTIENEHLANLRQYVSFVAIKNGEHDGIGYFSDTGGPLASQSFPLTQIHGRIREAFQLGPVGQR